MFKTAIAISFLFIFSCDKIGTPKNKVNKENKKFLFEIGDIQSIEYTLNEMLAFSSYEYHPNSSKIFAMIDFRSGDEYITYKEVSLNQDPLKEVFNNFKRIQIYNEDDYVQPENTDNCQILEDDINFVDIKIVTPTSVQEYRTYGYSCDRIDFGPTGIIIDWETFQTFNQLIRKYSDLPDSIGTTVELPEY